MTRDPYRSLAGLYDPVTGPFLAPVRRQVREALAGLGARRVLDACCGTGRPTGLLRRAGIGAMGVDASPAMLAVARASLPRGAPLGRMDVRDLAFADASFDAAVICLALHENAEPDRLAMGRELLRVVRPGGHALLVDYVAPARVSAMGLLVALAERLAGKDHHRNYRDFLSTGGVADFARRLGRRPAAIRPCLGGRAAIALLPA